MTGYAVVYSSDCPAGLKRVAADSTYVWQCDGTADEVQINAATAAVAATGQDASNKPSGGGGRVELVGFNFNISTPIILRSWVDISGTFGRAGTHVNAAIGFTGTAMFIDEYTYTELTTMHDLYIDGNNVAGIHGIYHNAQTLQTPFTYSDPKHIIYNLWILNMGGAGIMFAGSVRSTLLHTCHIGLTDGWGIDGSGLIDSVVGNLHLEGCGTAGSSGGIYAGGTSTNYDNIRCYNSHGHGIQSAASRTVWTNCTSIDSSYHNWLISLGKTVLDGCTSDSASLNNTNTYDGFHIMSVASTIMKACQSFDRNGTPHQRYGVYFDGSSLYSRFECVTYGNATGSRGGSADGTGTSSDIQGDSGGK